MHAQLLQVWTQYINRRSSTVGSEDDRRNPRASSTRTWVEAVSKSRDAELSSFRNRRDRNLYRPVSWFLETHFAPDREMGCRVEYFSFCLVSVLATRVVFINLLIEMDIVCTTSPQLDFHQLGATISHRIEPSVRSRSLDDFRDWQ
jgi:hypothetical protein